MSNYIYYCYSCQLQKNIFCRFPLYSLTNVIQVMRNLLHTCLESAFLKGFDLHFSGMFSSDQSVFTYMFYSILSCLSISGPDSQICLHYIFFQSIFANTIFLFTVLFLDRHHSSHRTCCIVSIMYTLNRINNDLHLHTKTVVQYGAII